MSVSAVVVCVAEPLRCQVELAPGGQRDSGLPGTVQQAVQRRFCQPVPQSLGLTRLVLGQQQVGAQNQPVACQYLSAPTGGQLQLTWKGAGAMERKRESV